MIVTSYQFQCYGTITAWRTYVHPSGSDHRDGVYTITFQVWRPTEEVGCHSLVGEDLYENIVLLESTGGLVNRTVPQPSNLSVQPGDVVGFFLVSSPGGENDGIQFSGTDEQGYDEEQAWYNKDFLTFSTPSCPFPVGPGRVLTASIHAAPVLSLDIGKIL